MSQKEHETILAQIERDERIIERHRLVTLPYGPKGNGWIIDDGVSGTLLDGRDFAKFIDDLKTGKLRPAPDYLVMYSLSRAARPDKSSGDMLKMIKSQQDAALIKAVLIGAGVQIIDEEGVIDPKSVLYDLKVMFSSEDHAAIRARTMAGKARHLKDGKFAKGGKAPFGYRQVFANGVDRRGGYALSPHPEEAKQLRAIYRWFIDPSKGGVTYAARMATEAEYPTPMASTTDRKCKAADWSPTRWTPKTVEHLVERVGVYLSGEIAYDFDGRRNVIKVEPLIDHELYERVKRREKEGTLKRRATFLTTGFLKCGCGENIYNRAFSTHHHTRCDVCRKSMRTADFERLLWDGLIWRLVQIEADAQRTAKIDGDGQRLAEITKALGDVTSKIEALLDLHLSGSLDRDVWTKRNGKLNDEKLALQAEAAEIKRQRAEATSKVTHETGVLRRIGRVLEEVTGSSLSLDRRREILRDMLAGDRLAVTWDATAEGRTFARVTLPAFRGLKALTVSMDGAKPMARQIFPKGIPSIRGEVRSALGLDGDLASFLAARRAKSA